MLQPTIRVAVDRAVLGTPAAPDARCSECCADAIAQRTHALGSLMRECFRGVTLGRLAIDLPGLLLLAYGAFVVTLIMLFLFGLISID